MANFQQSPLQNLPHPLKEIILATLAFSLSFPLLEALFSWAFSIPGPQTWTILSTFGIHHLWLWQPFTFLFVHGIPGAGISFGLLIEIAFHCYMIWALGASILERLGKKIFLQLYLGSGVVAGSITAFFLFFSSNSHFFGGSTPAILAILTLWTMMNNHAQLLLFFIFPIKAGFLLLATIAAITLVHLSNADFIGWIWMMSGMATGFVFGACQGYNSPFPQTKPIESWIKSMYSIFSLPTPSSNSRIFDIKTGRPVQSDEEIVDKILEKIAKKGKKSLTLRERWILYRASKKRQ